MLRWLLRDASIRPVLPCGSPSFRFCPFALSRYIVPILPSLHAARNLSKAVMLLVVWSVAALESLAASLPLQSKFLTSERSSMGAALLTLFSDQPGTKQPVANSMSRQSACRPATIARLRWRAPLMPLSSPIVDHLVPHLHLLQTIGLELHIACLYLHRII